MKKIRFFLLILLLPVATVFSSNYQKIVTLGPYVTENLYLLGLQHKIVGVTIHELPEKKKNIEIIGTLLEPNIEKILTLKPDIIIASKEGNRPAVVAKLKTFGIKVIVLEQLFSFNDICANFLHLGKIFGKEKEAGKIIQNEKRKLGKLKKKFSQNPGEKVFFCLGFKPIFTIGKKNYINEMIECAGGQNLFKEINKKYIPVNLEEVIKRNPDILIILKMGQDEKLLDFWRGFRQLNAVKTNKLFTVQDILIGSPTPRTFVIAVEKIGNFLK